ncbi:pseudouridine synthase [Melampsora americana]|nr:pseudouridine synthase [Melampsora americana]
MNTSETLLNYQTYSKESLILKIDELEKTQLKLKTDLKDLKDSLKNQTRFEKEENKRIDLNLIEEKSLSLKKEKKKLKPIKSIDQQKKFKFKSYPTRKIALRIVYQGWLHGGFSWQPEMTPLSTVEGELFKALIGSRLVEIPDRFDEEDRDRILKTEEWRETVDLERWEYSRAGRTDAGVSGSGQVVSLWVRSHLLDSKLRQKLMDSKESPMGSFRDPEGFERSDEEEEEEEEDQKLGNLSSLNSPPEELPYVTILNSILPESIRVIAWSPVSDRFDSRFSCIGRHYKYFFTKFEANPNQSLDLNAMREGTKKLMGEHDFRNLCRLDKSKQIENFKREIYSAEISLVKEDLMGLKVQKKDQIEGLRRIEDESNESNEMYVLDLKGSAFLYNQVRNIMAILFLIGSRLESPSVIDGLFYTDSSVKKPEGLELGIDEFVNRKPEMAIANELPLILWDCIYPMNTFKWKAESIYKSDGITPSKTLNLMRSQSIKHRLKSILILHQVEKLQKIYEEENERDPDELQSSSNSIEPVCQIFGAGESQWTKRYKKVLERPRLMIYSESNQRWLETKGLRRLAKRST